MPTKCHEDVVYAAVLGGEIEIDDQGRCWRVAFRQANRWTGGTRLIRCERRRAENKTTAGYLQVRMMINGVRWHTPAHRLVWRHANGALTPELMVVHKNKQLDDNRPDNLFVKKRAR